MTNPRQHGQHRDLPALEDAPPEPVSPMAEPQPAAQSGAPSPPSPPPAPFGPRFGRMFGIGQGRLSPDTVAQLAQAMSAVPGEAPDEDLPDGEENTDIDAGYTYIGQFVDHDLTFDPVSSLEGVRDPALVKNFRTPRLDLDSVYGSGPADQPYLYDSQGAKFVLGAVLHEGRASHDLPRAGEGGQRALIGDPRNDENRIIAQLHAMLLQFHNAVVDAVRVAQPGLESGPLFREAQRVVRWHYQFMLVHDFLPTIVDRDIVSSVLDGGNRVAQVSSDPTIPIEFSAACYRFGHSMVRPDYRLNDDEGGFGRVPVFPADGADPDRSLLGFRPVDARFAMDWKFLFRLDPNIDPTLPPADPRKSRQQRPPGDRPPKPLLKAYKIDTKVVFPMVNLPTAVLQGRSIAKANLSRSNQFSLPSAQEVRQELLAKGIDVGASLPLRVGSANGEKEVVDLSTVLKPEAFREVEAHTPLWYYALLEAQSRYEKGSVIVAGDEGDVFQNAGAPIRLCGIGGRIVAETIIGLLRSDPTSYLYVGPGGHPTWTPDEAGEPFAGRARQGETFGIIDIIRIAQPFYAKD